MELRRFAQSGLVNLSRPPPVSHWGVQASRDPQNSRWLMIFLGQALPPGTERVFCKVTHFLTSFSWSEGNGTFGPSCGFPRPSQGPAKDVSHTAPRYRKWRGCLRSWVRETVGTHRSYSPLSSAGVLLFSSGPSWHGRVLCGCDGRTAKQKAFPSPATRAWLPRTTK